MTKTGKDYADAMAGRREEVEAAKQVIESRMRLARAGVKPAGRGFNGRDATSRPAGSVSPLLVVRI